MTVFATHGDNRGSTSATMSDVVEKHTVSMSFVRAAVSHLQPDARERALSAAGIPSQLIEQVAARVPATAYSALWLAVARELDDEFFGLDRRAMKVGSFALVCQAVITCSDLDRALKRMLRGFSLFLDDILGELTLDGSSAVLRLHNRIAADSDRRFANETLLVLVHGLMCWLAGRRIPLTRVTFTDSRPHYAHEHNLMFSDEIEYSAAETTARFDGRMLSLPVVQNAATLQQFLRTAPQSVFLKFRNDQSWTSRLRRRLRDTVAESERWPVFEDLAKEQGTTPTTLRRRLEREGTSYQEIKDRLRSDVAIDYLCNSSLSVDEVAARAGFQDTSAFHRAFKRWNGVQPGEYRKRRSGEN
jgi:AraC-like DNA-binding protein